LTDATMYGGFEAVADGVETAEEGVGVTELAAPAEPAELLEPHAVAAVASAPMMIR
jgi:hypothetical protein